VETIAELRKICQMTAKADRSNVYMRYVCRSLSIYLTRLILPTKITANQVSFSMIVAGIFSTLFFLSPSPWLFFVGALLMQFWYLLDCMDGEVARYREYQLCGSVVTDKRTAALSGIYYDIINHYIMNLLVPASISFGLYKKTGNDIFILFGIFGAVGQVLLLAMHDAKHRVILLHLKKKYREVVIIDKTEEKNSASRKRSLFHWMFMILHYTMTYPMVMNLILIAAIINLFGPIWEMRICLLLYLTVGSAVVSATLITRTIAEQLIEKEFSEQFIPLVDSAAPLGKARE